MDDDQRSDEELARQVADGDEAAFAELYQRYFTQVFDFALRLTRDRDEAALVVQLSLLRVYQSLRARGPQASFKVQLFASVHQDVAERRRRRGAVLEGEEAFAVADPARLTNPALAAELPDLARMSWQVAREMKTDEYEPLDLSVRQQFDEGEIAAILRTRPEAVKTKLTRVRDPLEESFSALLLLNRGRRECLDLDFLVGDDEWSTSLRRRILRHHRSCEICQATCQRSLSATEALAALAPVSAPAGWQEEILTRLQNFARTGAAAAEPLAATPSVTSAPPGQPPGRPAEPAGAGGGVGGWFGRVFGEGGARWPLLAVLGGGLLVVIVVLAALCGAGAFSGGEPGPTASPTVTTTASPSATQTPSPTPTTTATSTPLPPLPAATPVPPTATPVPPPPTDTPAAPTPPSPTDTPPPPAPTATLPVPPTPTPTP